MRLNELDHVFSDVFDGRYRSIDKVGIDGVRYVNCQDTVKYLFDFSLKDYEARDYFQDYKRELITEDDYQVFSCCGFPQVYLNARGLLKLLVNSPSPVAKYKLREFDQNWLFDVLRAEIEE